MLFFVCFTERTCPGHLEPTNRAKWSVLVRLAITQSGRYFKPRITQSGRYLYGVQTMNKNLSERYFSDSAPKNHAKLSVSKNLYQTFI